MANTSDIKNGLCIKHNGKLFQIIEFQHVKPGKGPAFVRSKLRNLKTGKVLPNTFTSGVKINIQRVERRSYQYLYKEGEDLHFMNNETYEQTFLDQAIVGAPAAFLKEGQNVVQIVGTDLESTIYFTAQGDFELVE